MRVNTDGTLDRSELERSAQCKLGFAMQMVDDFSIHRTSEGELYTTYIRRVLGELAEDMIYAAKFNRGIDHCTI